MIKLIRRTILVNINDAKTQEETAILNVKFDDFIVACLVLDAVLHSLLELLLVVIYLKVLFEVKNSFIIKTFIRFEI
jgi:hypothetical protein